MAGIVGLTELQHTNGTSAMGIDASGRVTQPQIPCCFVRLSTGNAQDTSSPYTTTNTDIRFDKIFTNQGSCYSESTGRFTVPVAGIYEARCTMLTLNDTATNHQISIYKNGTAFHRGYNSVDSQYTNLNAQVLLDCNVNDYITVQLNQGHIYIDADGIYSSFIVRLVG